MRINEETERKKMGREREREKERRLKETKRRLKSPILVKEQLKQSSPHHVSFDITSLLFSPLVVHSIGVT